MKKLILLCTLMIFIMTSAFSQNKVKGTLYEADYWADIKGKGSWAIAMDNPTYEKVEVFLTEKYIQVTFGTKTSKYLVLSKKKFSEFKMDYNVTLDSKTYVLSIAIMPGGSTAINIDGLWMIPKIKTTSEIEVEE